MQHCPQQGSPAGKPLHAVACSDRLSLVENLRQAALLRPAHGARVVAEGGAMPDAEAPANIGACVPTKPSSQRREMRGGGGRGAPG